MGTNFITYLYTALRAGKCGVYQATAECGLCSGIIAANRRGRTKLRKKNARKLAQCAVRHINEQIAVKQAEIIELRKTGERLKWLYKKEFWTEEDDMEDETEVVR